MTKIECDGCGQAIDPLSDQFFKNPYYDQHFCVDCTPFVQDYLQDVFGPAFMRAQVETRNRMKNIARKYFEERSSSGRDGGPALEAVGSAPAEAAGKAPASKSA